jgi:hypothetical protein
VIRRPRVPRLPPNGRPDPRSTVVPSTAVRRRRGPRPPDAVIAALRAALVIELRESGALVNDAEPRPTLGTRWKEAAQKALRAIGIGARRGVVSALPPGAAREAARAAPTPAPAGWVATVTRAVQRALRAAALATILESASGAAARHVLREHARQVRIIAEAAGAGWYIWTTQNDSKVRAMHWRLEGTVQRWDRPPLTDLPDFHGCPGEPNQCRCQAYPIVRPPGPGSTPQR